MINRLLVLTLCVSTGVILGMRSPELRIAQQNHDIETLQSTKTGEFQSKLFPQNDLSVTNTSIPTANKNEPPALDWKTLIIQSDDNLSLIFDRQEISRQDLDKVMSLGKETTTLKNLMPGHELRLRHTDKQLDGLEYDISLTDTVRVTRQEDIFSAEIITTELETKINQAYGVISDSLFLSAQRSGVSDNLIMQVIDLFAWDIDFALDIREGDQFFILYEEKFKNGIKVQDGPVLAAEFLNQNHPFQAVRYTDTNGKSDYYNEQGFSMRKAFLRTPVNFTRISSGFSLARKHPILNRIRAHKGVDYAAPVGTPVKATSTGTVVLAGTNGGYGKMIVLRHGEKYSTAYGHLTRFAKGITTGKRVTQGQTIGYVGMTGLATGPHLHYEFRINGVHHNPLTVPLPKAPGIPEEQMSAFKEQTGPLLAQLGQVMARSSQPPADYKPVVALIKGPEADRALE